MATITIKKESKKLVGIEMPLIDHISVNAPHIVKRISGVISLATAILPRALHNTPIPHTAKTKTPVIRLIVKPPKK